MKITNLDALNVVDQKVILSGQEWIIPGEISTDIILKLINLQQKIQEDAMDYESWESIYETLFSVFKTRYPELNFEEFKKNLTARQTGALIGLFMNSLGEAQIDETEEKKIIQEDLVQNESTTD